MSPATDNTARETGGGDPRMRAAGPHLSEAARLAADAHRMLVASMLSLEAAEVEIAPTAGVEIAELLEDADAYATELLGVAGGMNALEPRAAIDEVVRDALEALDPPEIPFGDAPYVEMWDRAVAEFRERNNFRHLRDFGLSRSSILTQADLQQHLGYLEGFPEAQRAAIATFKQPQAECHAEMTRRATNRAADMAPEDWQKLTAGVVTACRDAAAAKVAGKLLRAVSLDPAFAYGLLFAWVQTFCNPPLPEEEVRDIFNRIARRQLAREMADA